MKLLTAKEACEMLSIRLPRLYELERQGVIPSVSVGARQVRFSEEVLIEWIRGGGTKLDKADAVLGDQRVEPVED